MPGMIHRGSPVRRRILMGGISVASGGPATSNKGYFPCRMKEYTSIGTPLAERIRDPTEGVPYHSGKDRGGR